MPNAADIVGGGVIAIVARAARISNWGSAAISVASIFKTQIGNFLLGSLQFNGELQACTAQNGGTLAPPGG